MRRIVPLLMTLKQRRAEYEQDYRASQDVRTSIDREGCGLEQGLFRTTLEQAGHCSQYVQGIQVQK